VKVYIGNCTQQVQDFCYRVLGTTKIRNQLIPIGGQQRLSGEFTETEAEEVIRQHTPYGMIRVSEIDRTKAFFGMCWDDKPIPVSRLRYAVEHNMQVLTQSGEQYRKEAAVAATVGTEQGLPPNALKALEMTVDEIPGVRERGHNEDSDTELFKEAIRVDRHTNPDGTPIRHEKKSRRRSA
jgi:hypothetical protein